MAIFSYALTGRFDENLSAVDREISKSVSASLEDASCFVGNGC